jgi:hypothetical protein
VIPYRVSFEEDRTVPLFFVMMDLIIDSAFFIDLIFRFFIPIMDVDGKLSFLLINDR